MVDSGNKINPKGSKDVCEILSELEGKPIQLYFRKDARIIPGPYEKILEGVDEKEPPMLHLYGNGIRTACFLEEVQSIAYKPNEKDSYVLIYHRG